MQKLLDMFRNHHFIKVGTKHKIKKVWSYDTLVEDHLHLGVIVNLQWQANLVYFKMYGNAIESTTTNTIP